MRLAKAARAGSFLLPALALVAVLACAGCGGSGDSSDTATTGSTGADEKNGSTVSGQRAEDTQSAGGKQGSGPRSAQAGDEPESRGASQRSQKGTTVSINLESPAFKTGTVLPFKYTCDGDNESPPLKWSNLPNGAAELVLLVLNGHPVDEAVFFDWAVAGLDPSLEELEAGKLPSGAIVGENSFGKRDYSLCPPKKGKEEIYFFMLFAIPKALSPEAGFDPQELRREVLDQSGNVGYISATYKPS